MVVHKTNYEANNKLCPVETSYEAINAIENLKKEDSTYVYYLGIYVGANNRRQENRRKKEIADTQKSDALVRQTSSVGIKVDD